MNDADLKLLGAATTYKYDKPDPDLLEWFERPLDSLGAKLTLRIEAPEFTSLCPKTGQPDFAKMVIEYEPRMRCVESKSLKLYLGTFRMHGAFHEQCVTTIGNALVVLLNPRWLTVQGQFTPRGGIPFWPQYDYTAHDFNR